MSWSINQRGLGTQISQATEGLFHRESEQSHHNEYSRIILAAHLEATRLYATAHPHTLLETNSYGHFNNDGTGQSGLTLSQAITEPTLFEEPAIERLL